MELQLTNDRAVLAMTLARAFLPPKTPEYAQALCTALADDLAEMAAGLGIDLAAPLASYRHACGHFHVESALVHYSRLFLAPPLAARLNLGWYLDGCLFGPTQDHIRRSLRAFGLDKREDFRDLVDHVATLLEFQAILENQASGDEAADFAHTLLIPGLTGLEADIAKVAPDSPYRHLAAIARQTLLALHPPVANDKPRRKPFAKRAARPDWVHCRRCNAPIATVRDLAVMRRALENAGLPADHLELCPDCRDAADGWGHRAIA